jgi:hypothetical protein
MRKEKHVATYYIGRPWFGSSKYFDSPDDLPKRGDVIYTTTGRRLLVLSKREETTRSELRPGTDLVTHSFDCEKTTRVR